MDRNAKYGTLNVVVRRPRNHRSSRPRRTCGALAVVAVSLPAACLVAGGCSLDDAGLAGDRGQVETPSVESGLPDATTAVEFPDDAASLSDVAREAPVQEDAQADAQDGSEGGAQRRVFVSSTASTANLGGPALADQHCQDLANAQGLGGTWLSWLSDDTTSPAKRFTRATVPYRLLDGTLVAKNWTDLTDGTLAHGIDRDEKQNVAINTEVWSGTFSSGSSTGKGCGGFTTGEQGAGTVPMGLTSATSYKWTYAYLQYCDRTNPRIYCFEQ